MSKIGTFTQSKDGYTGSIRTLKLNSKIQLVPTQEKKTETSPDFRVFAGTLDIGAGWKKTAQESGRSYVSVSIDDPTFAAPVYANLIEAESGELNLIWSRRDDR